MTEQKDKKVLFLFTELAGYIVACMKKLAEMPGVQVHVVKYPVNQVAPFKFLLEGDNIFFHERSSFNDYELGKWVEQLSPDIIFCSGWIDKGYVKICKKYRKQIKTVLTFDNPWRGTLKQYIASFAGPLYLQRTFSHCWVSGEPQRTFARKLGFKTTEIKEGFYSCDFELFHSFYSKYRKQKLTSFPHKFIYVGRYTKLKGTLELWEAFEKYCNKNPESDWELWCLGKGDFEEHFPDHPRIRNFGFVQPEQMESFIMDTGVFILSSHYEHWGVVVHEFAAAGFPLLCTTTTSAASAFLEHGVNGYYFEPCNVDSLVTTFEKITSMSDEELNNMGSKSADGASVITPMKWIATVINYLENE